MSLVLELFYSLLILFLFYSFRCLIDSFSFSSCIYLSEVKREMEKVKIYSGTIAVPLIVGLVIGLITAPAMSYSSLVQPSFAPPGFLFPIVWTILYALMGVSFGILKSSGLADTNASQIYYFQLIVNALWSIVFFVLKLRLLAFLWIILLIILVIKMIFIFYEKNTLARIITTTLSNLDYFCCCA